MLIMGKFLSEESKTRAIFLLQLIFLFSIKKSQLV
jgi:hypothetical protein